MESLDYAKLRLDSFLIEIARLLESEFPSSDSEDALKELQKVFLSHMENLHQFTNKSKPDIIEQQCSLTITKMFRYLPLLGFILRSTNVRNAFEVINPLRRLLRIILSTDQGENEEDVRLILGSEWEYSPYYYPRFTDLPGYVLIGLPAPESQNPLLIPLAGHEIGHAVWEKYNLANCFSTEFRNAIILELIKRWSEFKKLFPSITNNQGEIASDMFTRDAWKPIEIYVKSQAEEIFSDSIGVLLFGLSFLKAFAYLLSPGFSTQRSCDYPSNTKRIDYIENTCKKTNIDFPSGYKSFFRDEPLNANPQLSFLIEIADSVIDNVNSNMLEKANEIMIDKNIKANSKDEVERIVGCFKKLIPATNCKYLGDILNAGWMAYEMAELWEELPHVKKKKDVVLKDLILKTIEILEIEQITKGES
jgi:hypothetical protein